MDINNRASLIVKHPLFKPVMTGAVSFATGLGIGFLLGRRTKEVYIHELPGVDLSFDAEELLELKDVAERNEMKGHKTDLLVIDDPADQAVEDGHPSVGLRVVEDDPDVNSFVQSQLGRRLEVEEETVTVERRSVFASSGDSWDYEAELAKRTPEEPYVIHKDEFFNNELDYTQSTFTYYEGDNMLVDEDMTPIYNMPVVVGELKFGHGSDQEHVVYIRNDARRSEYEVVRDTGFYAREVLGLDDDEEMEAHDRVRDIRHAHRMKPEE